MPENNQIRSTEIRCPRLGSPVDFSYCEIENSGQPCLKSISCWAPYFDVMAVMEKRMGKENLESYFTKQSIPKVVTLIELIEKARQTVAQPKKEP